MAPLLVTALVGVGVKIATDLLMKGFTELTRPSAQSGSAQGGSFASTLDKARSAVAGAPVAAAGTSVIDVGLGDRSRVMAAELPNGVPAAGRAHGVASYRRFDEVQAP